MSEYSSRSDNNCCHCKAIVYVNVILNSWFYQARLLAGQFSYCWILALVQESMGRKKERHWQLPRSQHCPQTDKPRLQIIVVVLFFPLCHTFPLWHGRRWRVFGTGSRSAGVVTAEESPWLDVGGRGQFLARHLQPECNSFLLLRIKKINRVGLGSE